MNKICLDNRYSTTQFLVVSGDQNNEKIDSIKEKEEYVDGGLRTQGYAKTDDSSFPLVTLITVVLNGEKYLAETIKSVLSQTYKNIEYIVIDGGSSDNTINILRQNENCIDYWISQNDEGMYDALQKGFSIANGSIIGWLNSDDKLMAWALSLVVDAMINQKHKWVTGMPAFWDESGLLRAVGPMPVYPNYLIKQGWFHGKALGFIQQESTFFHSTVLNSLSLSEIEYFKKLKYAGDFFLWKKFAHKHSLLVLPTVLAGFRKHDDQLSLDIDSYQKEVSEIGCVSFPYPVGCVVKVCYKICAVIFGGLRQLHLLQKFLGRS